MVDTIRTIYKFHSENSIVNHHIHSVNTLEDGSFVLNCIGNDPQIYLPFMEFSDNFLYILEIETEENGQPWILYAQMHNSGDDVSFATYPLNFDSGRTRFVLPHGIPAQSLRLDCGTEPCRVIVKNLELIAVGRADLMNSIYIAPHQNLNFTLVKAPLQTSSNTVIFLRTHIVNPCVINEYKKICISGYRTVLFIDNSKNIFPVFNSSPHGRCKLYGSDVEYFLAEPAMYSDLDLPFISGYGNVNDFRWVMWYNGDYPFYVAKIHFPKYKFYWMLDYDVYLNSHDYVDWLDNYSGFADDLIVARYGRREPGSWGWLDKADWIYKGFRNFGCIYPIVRLSYNAIDFLLERRLIHKGIYKIKVKENPKRCRWIMAEYFTANELTNHAFSCVNLICGNELCVGSTEKATKRFYDEKLYKKFDNVLYHPVKAQIPLNEIGGR